MEALLTALGGETAGATRARPARSRGRRRLRPAGGRGHRGRGGLAASGLALVSRGARRRGRVLAGTGELIAAAVDAGAEVVLLACGGSATTDGGAGAIEGLGRPADCAARDGLPVRRAHAVRARSRGLRPAEGRRRRRGEAAHQAPGRAGRSAAARPAGMPLTGCAGGLSGGLWAAFDAVLEPGAAFVLDALGYDERMRAARAVIVGEGRIDDQTLQGKIAGEAATRARQAGVPCFAIVGPASSTPSARGSRHPTHYRGRRPRGDRGSGRLWPTSSDLYDSRRWRAGPSRSSATGRQSSRRGSPSSSSVAQPPQTSATCSPTASACRARTPSAG